MTGTLATARRSAAAAYDVARLRLLRRPLSPTRFVVYGRGRSGSTTLVSLLDALPDVRCDGEILNRSVPFPRSFVHARCAASGSPVYGCKILSYQVRDVQPLRHRTDFIRQLGDDGFRVIYLKRENLVEHAVSNIRAREFGFHRAASAGETEGRADLAVIEPAELMRWLAKSEALDEFEAACLDGVPHLALTYERDLAFEELHRPTAIRAAEFLGLPTAGLPPAESAFHKVSPRALSDSVANYGELVDVLAGTPYERFLS